MKGLSFDTVNGSGKSELLRFTSTKLAIRGEYDADGREHIEIRRDKYGQFKIKWSGHISIPSKETKRCDLGHKHSVDSDKTWVWNYATLSAKEAKAVAEFLLGGGNE